MAVPDDDVITKKSDATDYKIYQLQLVFRYRGEHGIDHYLAYILHFRYVSIKKRDLETGMWIVERTDNYDVIPVTSVVYDVYLIPVFDSQSTEKDVYSYNRYFVNRYSDRYAYMRFG